MLILASGSPRRRQLLDLLGVRYRVEAAGIDESLVPGETPAEAVLRLARSKGLAVADANPGRWVLSADTVVALDGRILGKPADEQEAIQMLASLSGNSHTVHTGVALCRSGEPAPAMHSTTVVRFRQLESVEIAAYVATGEPFGKAGAYAIQGLGGSLVDKIEGELSTVVGLTLSTTAQMLSGAGIRHRLSASMDRRTNSRTE